MQIEYPLKLEFIFRELENKATYASVQIVASVNYQQAIDKSAGPKLQIPRSGKMGLREEAMVTDGPTNRMGKALSAHMVKKLNTLINLFS